MQRIKKYVITEMPNGYPPTLHSTIMSTLRTFTSIFVYVARNDIKCKVPHSTTFTHGGIGVVIAKDVKLGGHCVIGHNVTIGTSHKGVPSLGWGVVVCCHSVIFGNCHIGHHSFIGAGSVVFKDIPPYSVAAGNPAVVIKTIKSDAEYWMYRRER